MMHKRRMVLMAHNDGRRAELYAIFSETDEYVCLVVCVLGRKTERERETYSRFYMRITAF